MRISDWSSDVCSSDLTDPFNNPPTQQEQGFVEKSLGLSVTPLTPTIARQPGAPEGIKGLVVVAADPNSDAGQKGFARRFILLQAHGQDLATKADLERASRDSKDEGRTAILLRVQPRGQPAGFEPV